MYIPGKEFRLQKCYFLCIICLVLIQPCLARAKDPLPSWNDGASKKAIVDFVAHVTTIGSPDYVPVEDRVATFDNDGTLWTERPAYTQFAFAIDRVKALAPQHSEWKSIQPFKGLLDGNLEPLQAGGEKELMQLMMATHSGMITAPPPSQ